MSALLLSPETIHRLGWTLIHFLWQGFALAILGYIVMLPVRKAAARYTLALTAFVAMALCPIVTFLALGPGTVPSLSFAPVFNGFAAPATLLSAATAGASPGYDWPGMVVVFWLAGILVFSVRALGGWIVLERLCRGNTETLPSRLRQRCLNFQRRLGIRTTVRYLESQSLDAPAVIGWLRPIVLLPVTAITGLSAQQLDAVIAHELAHIRRYDSLANLFQVTVESCLFYHPAVWWLSRRVRTEREHCCDDLAVALCGDATEYARALVLMEQWRATPALALGANSGSLRSRIARLLAIPATAGGVGTRGLAVIGILVMGGVLFASTSLTDRLPGFSGLNFNVSGYPGATPQYAPASPTPDTSATQLSRKPALFAIASAQSDRPAAPQSTRQPVHATSGESYIAGLESVGLKNLTADQLIALKVQGVTPQYIRELHAAGLNPDVNSLVALKVQGVDPTYVRDIRSTGLKPSVDDFIALRVQGVTPEYVRQIQSQGFKDVSVHDIIGMRVQGVKPSDFAEFERLGLKGMSIRDLIAFRVQGITPDYIHSLQSAGFTNLHTQDYIAAKVQGVTPEFIQKVKSHGFANLNIHQVIALKNSGVL